jgi:hypothetical protein
MTLPPQNPTPWEDQYVIFLSGTLACDGNAEGWTLKDGSGERTFTWRVAFQSAFANIPMVSVGMSGLDVSSGATKVYLGVKSSDSEGFELEIKTWGDTRVWAVAINWLAIGL